jgi:hypothetical protein
MLWFARLNDENQPFEIDSRNITTPRVLVFTCEPRAGNLLKFFKRMMHGRRDPLVLRGRLK